MEVMNQMTTPDSLEVGERKSVDWVDDVSRTDFVKYAGASGDFNPIHHDEPHAQEAGYPSVIGQGMFVAGILSELVAEWFGPRQVTAFETRFENPLFPGDAITVAAEIVELDTTAEQPTLELDLESTNQDGEVLVSGTATVELSS